jgi:hypothetical protein
VVTLEQKGRWDACEELATAIFGDPDPGEARARIWSATRKCYQMDILTDDECEWI